MADRRGARGYRPVRMSGCDYGTANWVTGRVGRLRSRISWSWCTMGRRGIWYGPPGWTMGCGPVSPGVGSVEACFCILRSAWCFCIRSHNIIICIHLTLAGHGKVALALISMSTSALEGRAVRFYSRHYGEATLLSTHIPIARSITSALVTRSLLLTTMRHLVFRTCECFRCYSH